MGSGRPERWSKKAVLALDVANHLGVSISTVSRALAANPSISQKTREKVIAAAKQLGYQRDPFAAIMTSKKSNIVCVLMSEIANPFFPELVPVMTDELRKLGYAVMLFYIDGAMGEEDAIRDALRYKPKFVIVTTVRTGFQFRNPELLSKTELVFVNRYVPGGDYLSVTCDNFKGGYELADLLIGTGHRRPAYIAGTPDSSTSRDRRGGFVERWKMANLNVDIEDSATSFSYECGYQAAKNLLEQVRGTDCIFCANDIMAMGAIDALRHELGLRVPEDISVVGFDDVQMAAWPSVKLTTYRYPKKRMIEELVDLLTMLTDQPGIMPVNKIVPGELIARSTHADRRHSSRSGAASESR